MLKKINYILDRKQKLHLVFLLAAFVIGSVFELIGVSAILPLVNVVMDPAVLDGGLYALLGRILQAADVRDFIVRYCVFLIAFYVFKNLYMLFMYNIQFRYTYNNKARISNDLMAVYMRQDYLELINRNVAELSRNLSVDVDLCFALILAVLNILCEGCTALVLGVYLLLQSPVVTLSLLVIMGLSVWLFSVFYRRRLAACGERYRQMDAVRQKWLLQTFNGIKEIKVSDREEYFYRHYETANYAFADAGRMQKLNEMLTRPVIETACFGGLLGIIAVQIGGGAAIQNYISVLSVFAMAAMRLLPSFNRIMSNASSVMASMPGLDALYEDMRQAARMRAVRTEQEGRPVRLETAVQVEHLTFCYPGKEEPVLRDVSLTIPKNHAVAFVGPSGAGKTTLADIILGLMPPHQGAVRVDGVDIYRNLAGWHRIVAYIPQTIYLIDDTIRANVLFGREAGPDSEARIWAALRSAQLDAFVRAQPDGLDTKVGDRGVKLSGGQRQRIGIARALYSQPQMLVLDEATSALDNETEAAVMEAISGLQGSMTMLIIAHRLSTIQGCDTVYEIKNGRVRQVEKEQVLEKTQQPAVL